jgi:hypothetical protein
MTCGKVPYAGFKDAAQVALHVSSGNRLEKPDRADDEM